MASFQITFYPDIQKSDLDSGVVSEISWQRLHDHLERAFELRDNERLIGISVTESGIKATFRTDKKPIPLNYDTLIK